MVLYSNFSQYSQKSNSNLTFSAYYTIQRAKVKITCLVKKLADKPDKPKTEFSKRALRRKEHLNRFCLSDIKTSHSTYQKHIDSVFTHLLDFFEIHTILRVLIATC
ncbi:unnamed protein product [Cuscuta epithymum]|uniref:Uncharacterized protein n=1 Tax=Cuscuta epithymum TaxID=186058 RepID=A0AAV0EQR8_9ASTE|nr:unnamed protein product [Cuscuta epithymum]